MSVNLSEPPQSIKTGTYTGDDTANKAVSHGLARTPKIILVTNRSNYQSFLGNEGAADWVWRRASDNNHQHTTSATALYFYIGNAGDYQVSVNASGVVYEWVAIG